MQTRRIITVFAALALIAGAFMLFRFSCISCGGNSSRPNLILISLDTLRADRLGTYGYQRETTPFLDSFAQRSVVFENTVAPAPWTLPSHVSMFSGLYDNSHGVDQAKEKIGAQTKLITEVLKEQGYQTFAFTGGAYVGKGYGFPRGFDEFHVDTKENIKGERSFANTLSRARQTLNKVPKDRNFFLFLHTYMAHCPYKPMAPYFSMFDSPGSRKVSPGHCGPTYNKLGLKADEALYVSDRYDGSIRQLDSFLKTFLEGLEADGLLKNTVVIITSDHGEEFLEHGLMGHQKSLFKELLMVPLIVKMPESVMRRVPTPVSGVDLFPTIIELLRLEGNYPVDGRSLASLIHGQSRYAGPSYQLSELDREASLRSLIDPLGRHFILDLQSSEALLFDLMQDPLEHNNIAAGNPQEIAEFKKNLEKTLENSHKLEAEETEEQSEELLKQLKSLGYVN